MTNIDNTQNGYYHTYYGYEKAEHQLSRKINPTCYSPQEWAKKINTANHFVTKIIKQPKIFLVGDEDEFKKFSKNKKTKI